MRRAFKIICFLAAMMGSSVFSFSQTPQRINYQGAARNASGTALSNAVLNLTISIANTSSGYSESHTVVSNAVGIFTLHIGGGTPQSGSFTGIDWSVNPTNLNVTIDPGSGPAVTTSQQLVSVPYALYAGKAASADLSFSGNVLSVGSSTVLIPASSYTAGSGISVGSGTITNTAPDQIVTISSGSNITVSGAYPSFTIASGGTLTSTPNTSVTGTGAATVTSTGTNTFNVAVTQPTFTGIGSTTVSGSFPSYTISTPVSSSTGDWSILGNSGTIDGTNFIGTTDNVALSFRVNNIKAGRLDPLGPTFFGLQAGNSNTDPGASAYGYKALFSNTGGAGNSAFGNSALTANTTGVGNTGFGYKALQANTTANYNTAVGYNALFSQSFSNSSTPYSTENVAIGHEAMFSTQPTTSITGVNNTAVGSYALHNNTTGYQNNAFGYQALYQNNTGINNIAIGNYALASNTTSQNNIGIGYVAMGGNATGSFNTAIGGQVMLNAGSGSNNTVMGWAAGTGVSGNAYSNNTIIGSNAGYNLTTGSGNVFLGNQAGFSETNGSNKLYIANNSASPLIYGDFAAAKVGIGTASPATALHVNGPVTITDGTQNPGYVLTSNASGTGSWQKPVAYTVAGVANQSIGNVNTTPAMFANTVPFTKQYAGSTIEIMCTMDVLVSSMTATGVTFEIMIDGVPSLGNAKAPYFSPSVGVQENITIIGVFPGITAGPHNVQFYAYTPSGTATNAILNSGGWVPQLVIKEN